MIVSPTFSLQSISSEIEDGSGIIIINEFRQSIIEELKEYQIEKKLEQEAQELETQEVEQKEEVYDEDMEAIYSSKNAILKIKLCRFKYQKMLDTLAYWIS